jgi:hypothetical protein
MQICIIVGDMIRSADARIVGDIAEIQTPHGMVEFVTWYPTYALAREELLRRYCSDLGKNG